MPAHLADYRAGLIEAHPDWEHRLWSEADLTWLQNRDPFNDAERFAPGSEGQFRSDIARYEILRLMGGVYVDCDVECLRPFDDLLDCEFFAARENDRFLGNTVLCSVPGHPLLVDLVDMLPARVAATAERGWRPNRITGPHYLTSVAESHEITVLPSVTFFPYAWDELDRAGEEFPDSYAAHHWANQRRLKGRPLV